MREKTISLFRTIAMLLLIHSLSDRGKQPAKESPFTNTETTAKEEKPTSNSRNQSQNRTQSREETKTAHKDGRRRGTQENRTQRRTAKTKEQTRTKGR